MNISEVAQLTGLTPKSIRLYEEKAMFPPPGRGENGYRVYHQSHVDDLCLIARARQAGFSLQECKELLQLANDPHRHSYEVKAAVGKKLDQVRRRLNELQLIQSQLEQWMAECPGNEQSECPIIEELKGHDCHHSHS